MKKLYLLLLTLSLLSCTMNVGVNDQAENVEVTKAMFEAFNQHDWEKMTSYYVEGALFLDPAFGIEYVAKSRTEIASKYREMQTVFPDLHDDVKGVYPSGDKVFVEFVATGTGSDGQKFTLPIGGVLTFENGKIVKDATYYDNSGE